ncbi:VOC family protein [Nitriliruptor alkaliphilus]|uniref:VOC family protein n=1 Tax=Nitriliruptor alkaliphilus TaxID=427918 RepID=UPI000696CECF|nr:VOC family protein [Nitriliruptor alkaliphilus]
MGITRLNHAVLYVRDADRHAAFYGDVLGFSEVTRLAMGAGRTGVFMRAPGSTNDHDVAFFGLGDTLGDSTAGRATVGLYHLAWEVPTLGDLAEHARRLSEAGALAGASDHGTTKALYARDPDGLEFEVSWLVPVELLGDDEALPTIAPLDLDAEIARYGADTRGQRTVPA